MNEDRREDEAVEDVPPELRDRLDKLSEHLVEDGPSDEEDDTRSAERPT